MDPLIGFPRVAEVYPLIGWEWHGNCAKDFVTAQKLILLVDFCAPQRGPTPTFLCKNIIPGELFVPFV